MLTMYDNGVRVGKRLQKRKLDSYITRLLLFGLLCHKSVQSELGQSNATRGSQKPVTSCRAFHPSFLLQTSVGQSGKTYFEDRCQGFLRMTTFAYQG